MSDSRLQGELASSFLLLSPPPLSSSSLLLPIRTGSSWTTWQLRTSPIVRSGPTVSPSFPPPIALSFPTPSPTPSPSCPSSPPSIRTWLLYHLPPPHCPFSFTGSYYGSAILCKKNASLLAFSSNFSRNPT
eukprot:336620-Hanusia_phi.AAC.4